MISVIGLNGEISKEYLQYVINRRVKSVGYKALFEGKSKNPIPWIESYINMDKNELLPQQAELTNYVSGGVDMSVDVDLKDFKSLIKK